MSQHPEGETRTDRGKQWLVGIGLLIVVSASVSTPLLVWRGNDSQNNHHAETAIQNATIIAQQRRIIQLEKQAKALGRQHSGGGQRMAIFV